MWDCEKRDKIKTMITEEKLNGWYEPKALVIEYDGRYCSSDCRRNGCPHQEVWSENLKTKFERASFNQRIEILKYLDQEEFVDIAEEIRFTHCFDCLGTGEVRSAGELIKCHCQSYQD